VGEQQLVLPGSDNCPAPHAWHASPDWYVFAGHGVQDFFEAE